MSRLSNVQNTYLAGNALLALTIIEIGVNGGSTLRYTDGPFDITYDGNTYEAQGNFLGISETSEVSELQITNISITLNGLDLTSIQTLCVSSQINQPVTIRKVFLDPNDYSLIGDSTGDKAVILFKGKIAGYKTVNATDTATITLDVNSLFTNFNRLSGRRTNQSSLQQEFANDFGFEYSHESIRDIKWGKV